MIRKSIWQRKAEDGSELFYWQFELNNREETCSGTFKLPVPYQNVQFQLQAISKGRGDVSLGLIHTEKLPLNVQLKLHLMNDGEKFHAIELTKKTQWPANEADHIYKPFRFSTFNDKAIQFKALKDEWSFDKGEHHLRLKVTSPAPRLRSEKRAPPRDTSSYDDSNDAMELELTLQSNDVIELSSDVASSDGTEGENDFSCDEAGQQDTDQEGKQEGQEFEEEDQRELSFNGQIIKTSKTNLVQLQQLFPIVSVFTVTGDDVEEDVLKAFNEFLSTGAIKDLSVELAFKVRERAYGTHQNLMAICERFVIDSMVDANCVTITKQAISYGDNQMIAKCKKRIDQLIYPLA